MRICMLGHKRVPSREGGIEIVVEELATRMVQMGHDVTCYNRGGHHVSGKEFDEKFHKSQALLHVEDFSEENIDLVKNSISTKIADSLGSGICLFAFAPKEVASMKYLMENNCAICCSEQGNLVDSLKKLFFNKEERRCVIDNALNMAKLNHEKGAVGKKVKDVFERIS